MQVVFPREKKQTADLMAKHPRGREAEEAGGEAPNQAILQLPTSLARPIT